MADVPMFAVCPPLRCGFPVDPLNFAFCGELAYWQRPGGEFDPVRFFCQKHRLAGDEPIPEYTMFRRITLTIDVVFAGVTLRQREAELEAFGRLQALLEAHGGLVNLHQVRSDVGRRRPERRAEEERRQRERPR